MKKNILMSDFFQFAVRRSTVYSGVGSLGLIPQLFKGLGASRILLLTDKGLTSAGTTEKVKNIIAEYAENGVELVGIYDDISADGSLKCVQRCLDSVIETKADGLLALGGGSVQDAAKAVKWMMYNHESDVECLINIFEKQSLYIEKWPDAKLMGVAHLSVPTTAGTGAEISTTASLFVDRGDKKVAIMNPYLGADIALLDPNILVSLPAKLTAETGCDAFSHAVEAFFSPKATPMSDASAIEAIKVISKYLPISVADGSNIDAREKMLFGNILGITAFGLALNRTPIHNVALAFGSNYHVPHGLGNAVLIPIVIEELKELYMPRIREFAEVIKLINLPQDDDQAFGEVVKWFYDFRKTVGIPGKFKNIKMAPLDTENIIKAVHEDTCGITYRIDDEVIKKIAAKCTEII